MSKWIKKLQTPDPKLGWCTKWQRNHCPNDRRGNNPGWCVHCNKEWTEK